MLNSLREGWDGRGEPRKAAMRVLEVFDPAAGAERERPTALLLVECRTKHTREPERMQIVEASIEIDYERVVPPMARHREARGSFSGGYRYLDGHPRLSLTTSDGSRVAAGEGGGFFVDPPLQGHRLGTYFMNEIVTWARHWPDAEINTITLDARHGYDANKEHRNRLYEQFGLVFDYTAGGERLSGKSLPMLAGALTPVETWRQNIVEKPLLQCMGEWLDKADTASVELEHRSRAVHELHAQLRDAEKRPLRWAMRKRFSAVREYLSRQIWLP